MNDSASRKFPDPAILDFGCDSEGMGRRLEQLGGIVVDRPLPATQADRRQEALWKTATVVFHESSRGQGHWDIRGRLPAPWQVEVPLAGGLALAEVCCSGRCSGLSPFLPPLRLVLCLAGPAD